MRLNKSEEKHSDSDVVMNLPLIRENSWTPARILFSILSWASAHSTRWLIKLDANRLKQLQHAQEKKKKLNYRFTDIQSSKFCADNASRTCLVRLQMFGKDDRYWWELAKIVMIWTVLQLCNYELWETGGCNYGLWAAEGCNYGQLRASTMVMRR